MLSHSDLPHSYETIPETTSHQDLAKHKWYRGKISADQAEAALSVGDHRFFVRHSYDELILSKKHNGRLSHTIIHHTPKGYQLEGENKLFGTIPEVIAHYQHSLGTPVETVPLGKQ